MRVTQVIFTIPPAPAGPSPTKGQGEADWVKETQPCCKVASLGGDSSVVSLKAQAVLGITQRPLQMEALSHSEEASLPACKPGMATPVWFLQEFREDTWTHVLMGPIKWKAVHGRVQTAWVQIPAAPLSTWHRTSRYPCPLMGNGGAEART